ncbi:MAG TPA: EpsD family peptidyl-prolyl cis-trans isomerase [Rhizobacter sp.]|nr:EpsD family peptidyl-prolyl cis-trans isomerase [Rhizobacter sp.]
MTAVFHSTVPFTQARGRTFVAVSLVIAGVLALTGCDKKGKAPTQAAARVNSQEITVHQINLALEQRALSPEQAASASRQVLARLIDQELAVQEAQNQKIDRDPRVVRQVEAAKREIVARAYVERIGANVARPTAEDVKKYYNANPALFQERRIYNLEELSIEAKPEQLDAIKKSLQDAKDSAAFVETLRAQGFKVVSRQGTAAAEQLPLDRLATFARMKDGESSFHPIPGGARVWVVVSSRSMPVDEEKARPAIEQFLFNERRTKAIKEDLSTLRAAAKIEYVGEFAGSGAPSATEVAPMDAPSIPLNGPAPTGAMVENALKGLK